MPSFNITRNLTHLCLVSLGTLIAACSPSAEGPAANGGAPNMSKGGAPANSGGTSSGGTNSQGGASQGGSLQGGTNNAQGGSNRGGSSNGGSSNGGSSNGGLSSGGSSMAQGGSNRGGSSNGGSSNGGAAGSSNGGSAGSSAAGSGSGGMLTHPSDPCAPRDGYRNLFKEVLGKSDDEITAKLDAGYASLFHGTGDQPVYYESGSDEAYILDINNNDVRSEGISYGMMISVHMNKQTEFNKIYKWAKSHMAMSNGLFSWQANRNGQVIGSSSAPDGEEYIAMALILASRRWGDGSGTFAYSSEAKKLLSAMANSGNFDSGSHIVTFGAGTGYSDPSYVLPAFYQTWACFDSGTASFWKAAVTAGRQMLQKSTNAQTGLGPYQASFSGTPRSGNGDFNSDSWRIIGNIMMDHHLYQADPWQPMIATTYANFFKKEIDKRPMPDEYQLNGTVKVTHADPAKALLAQHTMTGFAIPAADAKPFFDILWAMEIPKGQYRYYDGLIYMLTYLHVSGRFQLYDKK